MAAAAKQKPQTDAEKAAAVIARIRTDPVWFATEILGESLWSKQRAILESVRDNPRTAARSCHGVGKTFTASVVVPWWLAAWPDEAVAVVTAPTWLQVKEQVWREIHARLGKSKIGFPPANLTDLTLGDNWYAIGLSTDKPERFQGFHAGHLLLLVDEASGVDERIFEAGEGFLTADGARILLIGNPTQLAGQFHRAFTSERALWQQIHVSAFDSPNFTGEQVPQDVARRLVGPAWVEEKRQKWGEASPLYQVRVLGDFPSTSDNTVVGLAAAEAAQQREPDGVVVPLVVSCDVARFGSDETVIATRIGNRLELVDAYVGRDTMHTAGRILEVAIGLADRHGKRKAATVQIVVDDAGVGGGVTDRLREDGRFSVEAFNGGQAAVTIDEERGEPAYPNRRSEAWFAFADELDALSLDGDEQLLADLVAPTYRLDSRGRRVVEAKEETKKRLGRSPDRADAVLLLCAPGAPEAASSAWTDAYAEQLARISG